MRAPWTREPTPDPGGATRASSAVGPSGRARQAGSRVVGSRPTRVLARHLTSKGPLLAAGLTYQALFALFAALWVGFSVAGFVVSGDELLRDELIVFIRSAVPGLIQDADGTGVVDPELLLDASVFGWTGAVALVGLLASSVTLLGSMRDCVRIVFRAPQPVTPLGRLIVRDLGLGLAFGAAVVVSATLSLLSTSAVSGLLAGAGVPVRSVLGETTQRVVGVLLVFVFETAVLAVLFRVLAGLHIPFRRLLSGAVIGAAGFVSLTLVGGVVLRATGSNPLVASFAAIVGLLIVINLLCQVLLLSAGWIAVGMDDLGVHADPHQEAERLRRLEEDRLAEEARGRSRRGRLVTGARGLLARSLRAVRPGDPPDVPPTGPPVGPGDGARR
ncbi:YihY/virulence factor BrkB family protein [Frigoribacterium sp. VKM Ac-1396]|uniref:YihY/virulence factor BrkB family protein n=1 Tax=Frigoribacterium sp. VKM Ac-1396 TaxID=2783821 RepID=UPI001889F243|nr:YihY/virulence factor BrkB family protein [Frigoribacterium sp. VKM Ac-1396]MBF4600133.1 YihY/virulence factor BrkB family protein [Frigoribacterium sp. VKM Ac-1396]